MPTFLGAPLVAIIVTGRQNVGHGPLVAWSDYSPPIDNYDQFEFAATNQNLPGAVYLRAFGAVGEGPDGQEIRIEAFYSSHPIRLERNQDHRWETSFTGLADKGLDLERGVRG